MDVLIDWLGRWTLPTLVGLSVAWVLPGLMGCTQLADDLDPSRRVVAQVDTIVGAIQELGVAGTAHFRVYTQPVRVYVGPVVEVGLPVAVEATFDVNMLPQKPVQRIIHSGAPLPTGEPPEVAE